mmetsp:Transcript_54431/g.150987  ORF Transcript_54431/g.150987 Transcript_54431/m.150987 type:complete len:267 (-) Transcript_54431:20-820(-)
MPTAPGVQSMATGQSAEPAEPRMATRWRRRKCKAPLPVRPRMATALQEKSAAGMRARPGLRCRALWRARAGAWPRPASNAEWRARTGPRVRTRPKAGPQAQRSARPGARANAGTRAGSRRPARLRPRARSGPKRARPRVWARAASSRALGALPAAQPAWTSRVHRGTTWRATCTAAHSCSPIGRFVSRSCRALLAWTRTAGRWRPHRASRRQGTEPRREGSPDGRPSPTSRPRGWSAAGTGPPRAQRTPARRLRATPPGGPRTMMP